MAKQTKMTLWETPGVVTTTTAQRSTAAQRSTRVTKKVQPRSVFDLKGDPVFPNYGAYWTDMFGRRIDYRYYGSDIDYGGIAANLDQSSLVMAPCNFLGTMLSEAPPQVLERKQGESLDVIENHPLTQLLEKPNEFHTGDAFWLAFAIDWFCAGNVYWMKERGKKLQVQRLWYLPAFMVWPEWNPEDPETMITKYVYRVDGKRVEYLPEDIVHFRRGISKTNPRVGVGAFDSLLREVYADTMGAHFAAILMKNYGVVPFVVTPKTTPQGEPTVGFGPDPLQRRQRAQEIKETFISATTGDNRGQPIVNTIPLDIQKLGINPQELDFSKLRHINEARVAGVTGLPAQLLQYLVGLEYGTNRATYEQAVAQGFQMCVKPIQKIAASTIQHDLLPDFGSKEGNSENLVFHFDFSRVQALQEDTDKLYKREAEALRSGATTINEFNRAVGKPTTDGLDIYLIPKGALPMTIDTLKQIAADPSVLQSAMPSERALAQSAQGMAGLPALPGNKKPLALAPALPNGKKDNGNGNGFNHARLLTPEPRKAVPASKQAVDSGQVQKVLSVAAEVFPLPHPSDPEFHGRHNLTVVDDKLCLGVWVWDDDAAKMSAQLLMFDDEPMDMDGLWSALVTVRDDLQKKKPEIKYSADQPRDWHGRFGEGDGPSSAPGRTHRAGAAARAARAARATRSHVPMTKARRAKATESERQVAFLVGGTTTPDNRPFDVFVGKNGIECKTILSGKNPKITMHPESLARKLDAAKELNLTPHTIVVDARGDKPVYYYKQGIGSFRLSSMERVAAKDLRGLFKKR